MLRRGGERGDPGEVLLPLLPWRGAPDAGAADGRGEEVPRAVALAPSAHQGPLECQIHRPQLIEAAGQAGQEEQGEGADWPWSSAARECTSKLVAGDGVRRGAFLHVRGIELPRETEFRQGDPRYSIIAALFCGWHCTTVAAATITHKLAPSDLAAHR
jgi:hypothetical protein